MTTITATSEPQLTDKGGATDAALEALRSETPEEEVKYRAAMNKRGQPVYKDGQPLMLAYVTARYVADTLDDTVGPSNWQDSFEVISPAGAVRCGIGIRINGVWVWKFDVGVPSNIEPAKGAFSDAFKRAAVKWGIARDLYDERDEEPEAVQQDARDDQPRQPIQSRLRAAPGDEDDEDEVNRPQGTFRPRQQGRGRGGYAGRGRGGNVRRFTPRQRQAAPEIAEGEEEWDCPVHNTFKIVPPGVSNRTGKEYGAFYACPVPGCDERGPFLDD